VCFASVFRCGRIICSANSMERDLFGLVYAYSCLSEFVPVADMWLNVSNSYVFFYKASNPAHLC
jgi:hypothetical protein